MAIAFRSYSYQSNGIPHTPLNLAKPAGLANGDLLLLIVHTRTNRLGFDTPAGFTKIGETCPGEPMGETAAYYRVIASAAAEPSSYNVWPIDEHDDKYGMAVAYSGVNPLHPIVDSDFFVNYCKYNARARAGDVRVVKDGRTVAWATCQTTVSSWTTPTGFTERADVAGMALSDKGFTTNCRSGCYYFTGSGIYHPRWVQACHISLRPGNVAPNAPTLSWPVGDARFDNTTPQTFRWVFSDPNPGDTQSGYDLRYKLRDTPTWVTLSQQSPSAFRLFAAGSFNAGEYEWQVRCKDQGGLAGPYSDSGYFTAVAPPGAPTINLPTNNATVTQTQDVDWTVTNQDSFQVRTVADDNGSPDEGTVYTDSGEVVEPTTRRYEVEFGVNGRAEHVQVRVSYNQLWSTWATVKVNVSYTKPPTPYYVLVTHPDVGAFDVVVLNPPSTGSQPTVTRNEVWVDDDDEGLTAKATDVPPNSVFRYWTPASGRTYSPATVRVIARGDNGTYSESASGV